ncbi:MAG TPA: glycosyl hydrolase, partial [Bacteroidia bacterium]|nr:glycosyl hydrolase [Bacteroidia bacterium]
MNAWRKNNGNNIQSSGNWSPVGPFVVAPGNGWSPGIGRINGVAVNPLNSNVIYAGAPAGGLWKSNTGGNNFTTTTDHLPAIGFNSIAIDYVDTNIVYALSGDGDAGDTYSLGLLKSMDGGATWNVTGLNWNTINARLGHKVLIDPTDRNIIFVCTNNGIFRSNDAAASFTLVQGGNIFDMEFKPGNSNEMYAVGASSFYKSTNNGVSFSIVTNGLPAPLAANRFAIAVTPANNNYVYLIAGAASNSGFLGLWLSTDAGNTFNFITNTPNVMGWDMDGTDNGGQSWYTLTIAADPLNAAHIITGGVNVWESFDGGNSFNINAHWVINSQSYVHADIHFLDYINGNLYAGTDGGLFKWDQSALTWLDLSQGLQVSQFYRLATSATDPNFILAGAQDNGSISIINGNSEQWLGADGFEQAINPLNNNIIYGEAQYGGIYRSMDKGATSNYISGGISGSSDWDTPFLLNNIGHLFVGYEDIWRSTNNGNTFSNITNTGLGVLKYMDICESNQSVMYATNGQNVFKIDLNNGSVTDVTNGLAGTKSYIAVSDIDPNIVYATIGGFTAGAKVFKSTNGGLTWTNISGNLPNIPFNTIIEDTTSSQGVYVGSESGVFYTNNILGNWQL